MCSARMPYGSSLEVQQLVFQPLASFALLRQDAMRQLDLARLLRVRSSVAEPARSPRFAFTISCEIQR